MNRNFTKRALLAALLSTAALQAFAADIGVDAGTHVKNNASVTFEVGGVTQTTVPSNEADFVVDRKVDVVVAMVSGDNVSPGETGARLSFTVTNKTNDTLDFILDTAEGAGDTFDQPVAIWVDLDDDGILDAGENISYIDNLAEDTSVKVYLVGTIGAQADTDTSIKWLTAQAANVAGDAATPGAPLLETAGVDDPAVVDNVFADAAGDAGGVDEEGNGIHAASATYTVEATSITVAKSYKVIWENYDAATPGNSTNYTAGGEGSANLKPVPGALVEYCILVSNTGSVPAGNISVSDTLSTGGAESVVTNGDYLVDSIRIGTSCDYSTAVANDDNSTNEDQTANGGPLEDDDNDAPFGEYASYNGVTKVISSTVESVAGGSATATMFRVILK